MFHSLTMVTAQFSNFIIRINWSASNNNSCAEYIRRIGLATRIMKRLEHVWSQTNLSTSNQHIFHLHVGGTPPRLGNLDPYPTGLEAIGVVPHEVSAADPPHPIARLHTRRTGLLAASSIVRKRCLGLFGLVARLADDVPANQILRTCCEAQDCVWQCSDWRRARSRPPTTWTHQICRDTGVTVTDALRLAEDRSFWRQIATAGSTAERFACRNDKLIWTSSEKETLDQLSPCTWSYRIGTCRAAHGHCWTT